jgi:hypothetical protein
MGEVRNTQVYTILVEQLMGGKDLGKLNVDFKTVPKLVTVRIAICWDL